jgi:hypothetical protein
MAAVVAPTIGLPSVSFGPGGSVGGTNGIAEGVARRWPHNWYPGLETFAAVPFASAPPVMRATVAPYSVVMAQSGLGYQANSFPVLSPYLVGEPLPPIRATSTMGGPAR